MSVRRKNYLDPRDTRQVWPHNNRPSSRHRFKVTFQNGSEFGETCQRCGCHYNTRVGGTAAVYCVPTREWMAAHPDDDGRAGDGDTRFAAMMGMGAR